MKKTAPTISNPDELNKHLQRTSPATWAILASVAALLLAFFGWSCVAKVPIRVAGMATLYHGEASLHVEESDLKKLAIGQKVVIEGKEGVIESYQGETPKLSTFDLADGEYDCYVVLYEKRPIEFFWEK